MFQVIVPSLEDLNISQEFFDYGFYIQFLQKLSFWRKKLLDAIDQFQIVCLIDYLFSEILD